jgi:hypothetical protein
MTTQEKIRSYADLRNLIRDALRLQHPEWIGPDGECEMCNSYELRFAKLLDQNAFRGTSRNVGKAACPPKLNTDYARS